jgi:hypothetical protein
MKNGWLAAGAVVLGGAMIFADDIGSLVMGGIIGAGAVTASRVRWSKDKKP